MESQTGRSLNDYAYCQNCRMSFQLVTADPDFAVGNTPIYCKGCTSRGRLTRWHRCEDCEGVFHSCDFTMWGLCKECFDRE